ncbi:HsdM family class I SAM-dependent methyltransferase [Aeromonas caviae]|uniref:HsdM family class I SAM-dependent methyltransferase n=1 Tax=Aeromonas caviae TaxID=648 RepID=UPI002B4979F5|nr:N-6 DNA methylase [Aeromonas caviae]
MNDQTTARLSEALGVPSTHLILKQTNGETFKIFTVQNERGTNYLACALVAASNQKAEEDLKAVLRNSGTMSVGAVIGEDYRVFRVLRKSFRTGDFDLVANLDNSSIFATEDKTARSSLTPLTNRVENLLFDIHSAFRDIDGLHAPEALEEICKLVYAKLFDEENAIRTGEVLFQRSGRWSVEECAAEIRRLYDLAINDDKAIFSNKIPSYDRSRGVFKETLLLSSAAIVRATEILQHYDISSSPVDIKGRAFQNVLLPAVRSGMGQYFTPKEVIDFIICMMSPNVRELVVDPFCGSGHFLTSALDYVRNSHGKADKLFHEFAFTRLHGIEKSDRMVRIAMTDMRLHGDGHSNIRCTDALLPFDNYPDLYRETFDLVVTNPPFGVDLPADALHQFGPFELALDRKTAISLEIVALERCLQLLKPGGRMAIVIPDGVLSNKNTQYVRDWLVEHAVIRAIVSLPIETFSPFGANIKTSVLVLRKLRPNEDISKLRKVFMSEISNVGYDASGRPCSSSDLDELLSEFRDFVAKEEW